MKPEIADRLHRINQEFYQTFALSFAATRRRIQPGVRRLLADIPAQGTWLDIGCGSGALAVEWLRQGRRGCYHGVDFSAGLIAEAEKAVHAVKKPAGLAVGFSAADLMADGWQVPYNSTRWDGALCFAVLHHIPGASKRHKLCSAVAELLGANARLHVSVWQVNRSPRLLKRIQPWQTAGIASEDLEDGDILMDWRAGEQQHAGAGLRYVHVFSEQELSGLAESCGFKVADCFYSDGREGSLGLYQTWIKIL